MKLGLQNYAVVIQIEHGYIKFNSNKVKQFTKA
jgi:hypothetical protein